MVTFSDPDGVRRGPDHGAHAWFHAASCISPIVQRHLPAAGAGVRGNESPTDGGKGYAAASEGVPLSQSARTTPPISLVDALRARRSSRQFAERSVAFVQLSAVLGAYCCTGRIATPAGPLTLRTAPSAGGIFPVETYVAAASVGGLASGVYHYRPTDATLTPIHDLPGQDVTATLSSLVLDPAQAWNAAGGILLTARFGRSAARYGERAYRYALIEAGHIAQVMALGAVDAGIGLVFHGAFYDHLASHLLGLDGITEAVVGILLFGANTVD